MVHSSRTASQSSSCEMSLYYEAAQILDSGQAGSLKSRVFGAKGLKSPTSQVFALLTEASKWSQILTEVIEKAALLQHERKVELLCLSDRRAMTLKVGASCLLLLHYSLFTTSCSPRKAFLHQPHILCD